VPTKNARFVAEGLKKSIKLMIKLFTHTLVASLSISLSASPGLKHFGLFSSIFLIGLTEGILSSGNSVLTGFFVSTLTRTFLRNFFASIIYLNF
jgi:hypothetical protein